jgi:hypothetical protein
VGAKLRFLFLKALDNSKKIVTFATSLNKMNKKANL